MNQYSAIFEHAFTEQTSIVHNEDMVIEQWSGPQKEGCPGECCIEKNAFRDDVYVVIQGHTNHMGELFGQYRGYKNIIWVMDDTSSLRDYSLMANTRINPVVIKRPNNPGYGNINLQSVSTVAGLKHAKKLGAKYCIKIRSDMIFSPLHKFIDIADFSRLGFISYVTFPYDSFEKPMESISPYISNFIKLNKIESPHNLSKNYVLDFCVIGPVDELISFFDYTEFPDRDPDVADGKLHGNIPSPAECKYLLNYLLKKGYEMDNSIEGLKKRFNFFVSVLEEHKIDLISIKNDYSNLAHLRKPLNWNMGA